MTCLRCEREHMLSQARAAIAAAEPPGWKLVPVEPTLGMLRALTKYLGTGSDEFAAKWALGSFSKDYAAMLDAAPPPGADK
jgi:hypothetical protein